MTPSDGGSVSIINNGKALSYTAPSGFRSPSVGGITYPADGFNYQIVDANGATAWGTVSIILAAEDIPRSTIVSPPDQYTTNVGAIVALTAYVTPNQYVTNVSFYRGSTLLGSTNVGSNGTYTFYWSATLPTCDCPISAAATDLFGQTAPSPTINLNVTNGTGNGGPVASLLTFTNSAGPAVFNNQPVVRDGQLAVFGQAYHTANSNIVWQLGIYGTDGSFIRNLTGLNSNVVGSATTSNLLANCDLSTLRNGVYDLKLTVNGGYVTTECTVPFQLESNLKIRQFSFSQQDLMIPVAGIPLSVTRTYSSLNPDLGDFGYGWTWALNDRHGNYPG